MNGRPCNLGTWRDAFVAETGPETMAQVAVCWTLSWHMNQRGGSCWPSVATVARESRLDERTVRRALRALEEAGWLLVERGGGRANPNRYQAAVPDPTLFDAPSPNGHKKGGVKPSLRVANTGALMQERGAPRSRKGGTVPAEVPRTTPRGPQSRTGRDEVLDRDHAVVAALVERSLGLPVSVKLVASREEPASRDPIDRLLAVIPAEEVQSNTRQVLVRVFGALPPHLVELAREELLAAHGVRSPVRYLVGIGRRMTTPGVPAYA